MVQLMFLSQMKCVHTISVNVSLFQCENCGGEMNPTYYKGIHRQETLRCKWRNNHDKSQ